MHTLFFGVSSDPDAQLHTLLVILCGVYGALAIVSCVFFGLLIKRGGCALTRHAVFHFLLILVVGSKCCYEIAVCVLTVCSPYFKLRRECCK